MSVPIFDPRTAPVFFENALALAAQYCQQWGLPDEGALTADAIAQDPGLVLLKLFSLLGQDLANVRNAMPVQRQLALYRFLDMNLRGAACASAPLSFSLAAKHASVFLPKGTAVLASSLRHVRFETDSDVQVVPATLSAALTVQARLDRYLDVQSLWNNGEPAPAFPGRAVDDGEHAFAHALLIGDPELFLNAGAPNGMTITLRGRRLDPDYFRNWFDGALRPLPPVMAAAPNGALSRRPSQPTVTGSPDGTFCMIEFDALPSTAAQTVAALHASLGARAGRQLDVTDPSLAACPSTQLNWLVCAPIDSAGVVPALNGYLPQIDSIWCDFGVLSTAPQQAAANGLIVDPIAGAYPFGLTPRQDSSFCIRCDRAFSEVSAPIKLTFDLRPVTNNPSAQVQWQYWNGASWQSLATMDDRYSFADDTRNLTAAGTISFICPEIAQTSVAGNQGMWIRVVLLAGDYSDGRSGYLPPFVRSLVIEYPSGGAPSSIWAHNAFRLDALSVTPYEPYRPHADEGAALYLAFGASELLAYGLGQRLTLYIDIDPADEYLGHGNAGEWQWFDATNASWTPLEIDVGDAGLARSGALSFIVPALLQASVFFSKTACWFRVLCPHRMHPLRVRGIYPNTVGACNRATYSNEVLGSSNGQPGQRFILNRVATTPAGADQVLLAASQDPGYGVQVQVVEPVTSEAITLGAIATQQTAPYPWTRVPSFVGQGPGDRVFVADIAAGAIVFGDGKHGRIPPPGQHNVIATCYATTRGAEGNVAAGVLTDLYTATQGVSRVTNPVAARGGADADRVDDLIGSGPALARANDRAVSAADVEALARLANAGICQVQAIEHTVAPMLFEPDPAPIGGMVDSGEQTLLDPRRGPQLELVVLARSSDPEPLTPMSMLDDVLGYVRARGTPWLAARTTARRPTFKRIDVAVLLEIDAPKSQWAVLQAKLALQLTQFLHPALGGTAADGWAIGEPMRYIAVHTFLLEASAAVTAVVAMTLCGQTGDLSLVPGEVPAAGAIDIRFAQGMQS